MVIFKRIREGDTQARLEVFLPTWKILIQKGVAYRDETRALMTPSAELWDNEEDHPILFEEDNAVLLQTLAGFNSGVSVSKSAYFLILPIV